MLPRNLKNDIVVKVCSNKEVRRSILFGSYARGTPGAESDVDIVVILDKKGFSRSYTEMLETRMRISKPLLELRKKVPIDILVYTADEWEKMTQLQSDFIRNVQEEGVDLL
jgi:predicted nucleotidyltransferase